MSRLVPLLVVVSIGLGASAVWLNQQLTAERSRASAFAESLAKVEAKAADLEKEANRLREMNGIFQSESEQLRKMLASRPGEENSSSSEPGKVEAPAPVEQEGEDKQKDKGNFAQAWAKMFKDPEMKKVMRSQQAMGIRMMYGDLAKELGLTPDEATQITELLTDRQQAMAAQGMEMMNNENRDEAKLQEVSQSMNASREEYDKQIESILGKDRYAKMQKYEQTIGERMAVSQLQQQFAARGVTLAEPQRQNLLQVMVDERRKTPQTPWNPAKPDVAAQVQAMNSDETMEQIFNDQKQMNSRVLSRARSFLTPDQVSALQQSQDEFLQMQQMGMKMGRAMLKK